MLNFLLRLQGQGGRQVRISAPDGFSIRACIKLRSVVKLLFEGISLDMFSCCYIYMNFHMILSKNTIVMWFSFCSVIYLYVNILYWHLHFLFFKAERKQGNCVSTEQKYGCLGAERSD